MNNFQNGWLGTIQVQPRVRLKRITPWRAEKYDDEMIGGMFPQAHKVFVTAVDEFDWRVEVSNISRGQFEDRRLDLKTDAPRAG